MKKLLTLCLALTMLTVFCLPTYAGVSPEADVITPSGDDNSNDTAQTNVPDGDSNGTAQTNVPDGSNTSSTSPQTGNTWIVLVAGAAVASMAAACVAGKKLSAEN